MQSLHRSTQASSHQFIIEESTNKQTILEVNAFNLFKQVIQQKVFHSSNETIALRLQTLYGSPLSTTCLQQNQQGIIALHSKNSLNLAHSFEAKYKARDLNQVNNLTMSAMTIALQCRAIFNSINLIVFQAQANMRQSMR